MFDDNHIDNLVKSILESGQEDVPAHVWEGISADLDKEARRKNIVVLFKRVGTVAAAAAIAVGVLMNIDRESNLVPAADADMVAVIENKVHGDAGEPALIAQADDITDFIEDTIEQAAIQMTEDTGYEAALTEESKTLQAPAETPESAMAPNTEASETSADQVREISSWDEDETELKENIQPKVSLVLSGIAGTNNPQNRAGLSPMKSPSLGKQYSKTTIEQTGTEILYGIPISFGAGVRLHFTDRWSLGMGLNYTLLTSRFDGRYIKVENGMADQPVSANIRNTLHYIGIPVNAYYDIVRRDFIDFYVYAGGTVEKCIANRYHVQTDQVIYHKEQVSGAQLSANAGIGVEFRLGKYVGLYLDPSLRYYFRNGQPKSIRTAQPLMLGFEMGLRFNL